MIYFSRDFNEFFKELAANNRKDWFDENRIRYHKSVKEPFENFLKDLIDAVRVFEPELDQKPGQAAFRINRDIRFAKDKSPYKLNRSALISKYGRKEAAHPGLYIDLGPERVYLAGGAYQPDKNQLMKIRTAIAENTKTFHEVLDSPDFKKYFGKIRGEENKRLPTKDLTEAAEIEPLIYKKQFYYQCEMSPEAIESDDFLEQIMMRYKAAQPVASFMEDALNR